MAVRAVRTAKVVLQDFLRIRGDVEPIEQFYSLRPDARMTHGLQYWSASEWRSHMQAHRLSATELITGLLGSEHGSEDGFESASREMEAKLSQPMHLSEWKRVIAFQNAVLNHESERETAGELHYMSPALLSTMMFDQEYPLGIEESVLRERHKFAITHSGQRSRYHRNNVVISCLIYTLVVGGLLAVFGFLLYSMSTGSWTLEDTVQNKHLPGISAIIINRGRDRARIASLITSLTYSLCVNASLDKFGRIDPSTSTVLIGMTIGGTWGFMLDMVFGTDEGFREYLWEPHRGMAYAFGSLVSPRYLRFIVTILFDMFFTVIMFKKLYSRLVLFAGFTVRGREWIANGFCSTLINIISFTSSAPLSTWL